MRYVIIIFFFLFSCASKGYYRTETRSDLSQEDYLLINVFLEQFKSKMYMNLLVVHNIDSTFSNSYLRKIKLYKSFKKLCDKNLSDNKKLTYETNFSCSTAEKFKIYMDLFTKEEYKEYSKKLANQDNLNLLIDYNKIFNSNLKPLGENENFNDKRKVLRLAGLYYNKNRTKVLIRYSINNKTLYHVLKKEDRWWKNIINF